MAFEVDWLLHTFEDFQNQISDPQLLAPACPAWLMMFESLETQIAAIEDWGFRLRQVQQSISLSIRKTTLNFH